jgi:hypothetical protein
MIVITSITQHTEMEALLRCADLKIGPAATSRANRKRCWSSASACQGPTDTWEERRLTTSVMDDHHCCLVAPRPRQYVPHWTVCLTAGVLCCRCRPVRRGQQVELHQMGSVGTCSIKKPIKVLRSEIPIRRRAWTGAQTRFLVGQNSFLFGHGLFPRARFLVPCPP